MRTFNKGLKTIKLCQFYVSFYHFLITFLPQLFNIEVLTVVRGKGLCKLASNSARFPMNNSIIKIDESFLKKEIYFFPPPEDFWYFDIRILLEMGSAPNNLETKKIRALRLKSVAYQLINNIVLGKIQMVYYCVFLIKMELKQL